MNRPPSHLTMLLSRHTRRRDLIALAAIMTALRPLAGAAQQKALPVIGFLSSRAPKDSAEGLAAFRRGLSQTGYEDGQNVEIQFRWGEAGYDRRPGRAADLGGRKVAVLVAVGGEPSALAAKTATATIPIVFS